MAQIVTSLNGGDNIDNLVFRLITAGASGGVVMPTAALPAWLTFSQLGTCQFELVTKLGKLSYRVAKEFRY